MDVQVRYSEWTYMKDTKDGRTCKILRMDVHVRYPDERTGTILRTDVHVR